MRDFIIKVEQIQALLNILGEFPAKQVIQAIDMLRQLPEHHVKEEEKPKE